MELLDYFRRQFAYSAWANREVLSAMRDSGAQAPRLLSLMAHIVSAEWLWLERLKRQPQSLPVWPELDLRKCEEQAEAIAGSWREYLAPMSWPSLSDEIAYRNSKGETWNSTVQDVLTHVLMHSAYHRGQIASLMRTNGQTPAYTDFIHAVRQRLIE